MTRFSIITLAYKVEDYLDECLRSVLVQSLADFEIIAVDNGSPDSCGNIIDRRAGADRRVVPLHLDRSLDMGEARNAGMLRATGDYLLFLDGDDTLATTSSLYAISQGLEVNGHPDVLIYDFCYRRYCDLRRTSNLSRVLPQDCGVFRLRDRRQAIGVSWSSCNKAYRRSLIETAGLRFPPGYYEDSVWSCMCLLRAGTIGVLRTVCMNYRCCRRDSVSRKPSLRHLEVFDQYERIFRFLDDHPDLEFPGIRSEIMEIMSTFLRALGGGRQVIPVEVRQAFHRRSEDYIRRRNCLIGRYR